MLVDQITALILMGMILNDFDIENPYPNEHAVRLKSRKDFKEKPDWSTKGKFRRTPNGKIFVNKKVPKTVDVIWGQLKTQKGQTAAPQALRFPTKNWTAARARKWLKDNKVTFILFEPATGPRKDQTNPEPGTGNDNKNWFRIENKDSKKALVFLYDHIGHFGVSASDFMNQFNTIKAKNVELHIDSPGGLCHMGFAIYNNLKNSGKNIHVLIDGMAASMASVIAMVGNKITMPNNALLMIHNPQSCICGDAGKMRKQAELLDRIQEQIAEIYSDKSGKTIDEIKKKMEAETWFTGKEALAFGLVDENEGEIKRAADYHIDDMEIEFKNLDKFNNFINIKNTRPDNPNSKTEDQIMDLAELKTKHPDVYNQIVKDTRAEVNDDLEGALEAERGKGAEAERKRIEGINSIKVSGDKAQEIINKALADPKANKETVAVQLLDAQATDSTIKIEQRKTDGADLTNKTKNIDNNTPEAETETGEYDAKKDDEEAKAAAKAAGVDGGAKMEVANN